MSRFGGIAVEDSSGSKFGGVPVEEPPLTIGNMHKFAIQGLTGSEVDTETGLDFWSRFDISFSDTDEEKANKFMKGHPDGALHRINIPELNSSYLLFKFKADNPDEKWKTVEDEGFTLADVADVAGGTPEFVASTAPFFVPGVREASLGVQALAAGGGAMVGHLAKEGVEELRGTQLQPGLQVLYDALGRGGITAATTAATGVAQKAIRGITGRGALEATPEDQALLEAIGERPALKDKVPLAVISPEHKIAQRITAQAISTSKHGEQFIKSAEKAAVDEFKDLVGPDDYVSLSKELRGVISKVLGKGKAIILAQTRRTPLERGGKSAITGLEDDFVRNSSSVSKTLYSQVDDAANRLKPEFDLTDSINFAKELKKGLIAEGADAPVNVAEGPQRELLSVVNDLVKLDPTQTDYNVVKELRTRLFDLVDNQPWQWDTNKYQASQLWRKLSTTLMNPTNQADDYVKAIKTANSFWKKRSDILSDSHIQKIIRTDTPVDIAKKLSDEGQFTENVEYALTKFAPKKAKEVKDSIKYYWLVNKPGKAVENINRLREVDKMGFNRVVPKSELQPLLDLAKQMDTLNSSRMKQVFDRQLGAGKLVKGLINEQDVEGIELIIKQLGGNKSKGSKLLKAGILEDMLNESTELTQKNTLRINANTFAAKWREYNRNGILDKLMPIEDKKALEALKIYSKLWERSVDPGVSLEAAQLISLLKHPKTFIQGSHGLAMNEALAWIMLSPKTRDFLVGRGTQPIAGAYPKVMAIALEDMISTMDASDEDKLLQTLDE